MKGWVMVMVMVDGGGLVVVVSSQRKLDQAARAVDIYARLALTIV